MRAVSRNGAWMSVLGLALALALPAAAAAQGDDDEPPVEACSSGPRTLSKLGDRVYPDQGNAGYSSVHTDLHVPYDPLTTQPRSGTHADLTIRTTQGLTDFSFDFERAAMNG